MKKFLLIFSIATCFALASNAQWFQGQMKSAANGGVDSVTAAGVTPNYLYITLTQGYRCAAIQTIARRKTSAQGGTITMEGSNDNVTWQSFSSTNLDNDSVTVADAATSSGKLIIPASHGPVWKILRVKYINASSDTSYLKANINLR